MDSKELRGLMEAYSEVYAPQQLDEISQKTATSAYAQRRTGEFEGDDASDRVAKTNKLKGRIEKKFGKEAGKHADRAADVQTFGRKDASGRRKQSPQPRIQTSDHENQREFKRELRIRRDRRLRAARGEDTNEQFDIFVDEGYQRDPEGAERKKTHSKQPDPSKSGFTGIGNMSIDQIRKMSARIEKENTKKEEVDIYDIILSHLLDEGYADTKQAAEAIMVNMSEEWRDSIVEGIGTKLAAAGLAGIMGAGMMNAQNSVIAKRQYPGGPLERDKTELVSKADKEKKDAEERRQAELYAQGRVDQARRAGIIK